MLPHALFRCVEATAVLFLALAMNTFAAPFDLELRLGYDDPDQPANQWRESQWKPFETAFIICDMWDSHHSVTAVRRVNEFAPRSKNIGFHFHRTGLRA